MTKKCDRCGRTKITSLVTYKENISYFFRRQEREFSGRVCFGCMTLKFVEFELVTLVGTWWGIIGFLLGPVFILMNLLEYISGSFLILHDATKMWTERGRATLYTERGDQPNSRQPQEGQSVPEAAFASALLTLFKSTDASTLIYKEAGRWVDELLDDAGDAVASKKLIADAAAIRKFVGAEEYSDLTIHQHQRFAYRFESYLLEGTAPNFELAGVFAQFKLWLTTIYQRVEKSGGPISDDIRHWYNRVLS